LVLVEVLFSGQEVDALWEKLSLGGKALMELSSYPFSERYGWTQDRYGLSWQVMFMKDREVKQKITPTLMFVGDQCGKAEAAVNLYTAVFHNSAIDHIMRYGKGEEPDKEGTVRHTGFTLESQEFAAMDRRPPNTTLHLMKPFLLWWNVGIRKKLTTFGINSLKTVGMKAIVAGSRTSLAFSWQITPTILGKMLQDRDKEKVERVTNAFLMMKKFDIGELKKVYSFADIVWMGGRYP
jgi:predicted 3-demethylubiquinone-9 3-methyltransferase (glyoxalase superfamily)